jgi:hypothetical protein
MAPAADPADEVPGVPRQRTHLAGRDVEPVLGIIGGVRNPPAELLPPLDQDDP